MHENIHFLKEKINPKEIFLTTHPIFLGPLQEGFFSNILTQFTTNLSKDNFFVCMYKLLQYEHFLLDGMTHLNVGIESRMIKLVSVID